MSESIVDYQEVIVNKPWGYEYLMYQNDMVAVWHLCIKYGARTSLHCHPHKKTGLILLSGEVVVSFLNDSVTLEPLSKLMIRAGLFHSTAAVSPEGAIVIEVETPCDKTNLVRFEDEYAREEEPYEGPEAMIPITESCIQLDDPRDDKQSKYTMHGCVLSVERIKDISGLRQRPPGEIIVGLEGGLVSRTGEPVFGPGDVISTRTLDRLVETFSLRNGISLLTIQKEG